jgi:hypothetical protein
VRQGALHDAPAFPEDAIHAFNARILLPIIKHGLDPTHLLLVMQQQGRIAGEQHATKAALKSGLVKALLRRIEGRDRLGGVMFNGHGGHGNSRHASKGS